MSQHWTKVQIKEKKPAPRRNHATLCIEDPHAGHHPLLMVVGGSGGSSVLSDVWLLDVINGVWTEVCVHFYNIYIYHHMHTVYFSISYVHLCVHIYSGMYGMCISMCIK